MKPRAERKRAEQVAGVLAELEQEGTLNRLAESGEPCEGPRQEGCLSGQALAVFAVTHGGDAYLVCLACLAALVLEHLEELETLKREELRI